MSYPTLPHPLCALATASWLLTACGPALEPEATSSGGGSTSVGSTSVDPPAVTTAVPPADDTAGPLDTGAPDSGATWDDLPEDCSTIRQDCPPGYKCMPWATDGGNSWNDTKCSPIVDDPHAVGEPCSYFGPATSGEDDCDGRSMCWDVDPELNVGQCQPFCIGDEDEPTCAEACDFCPVFGDGAITLCFPTCDPIVQGCPPGQGCYPVQDLFVCSPDGAPRGSAIGAPCESVNACPPGLVCLASSAVPGCEGGSGCCTPYCPFGDADPCPDLLPGTVCAEWYAGDPPLPEGCVSTPVGACTAP